MAGNQGLRPWVATALIQHGAGISRFAGLPASSMYVVAITDTSTCGHACPVLGADDTDTEQTLMFRTGDSDLVAPTLATLTIRFIRSIGLSVQGWLFLRGHKRLIRVPPETQRFASRRTTLPDSIMPVIFFWFYSWKTVAGMS